MNTMLKKNGAAAMLLRLMIGAIVGGCAAALFMTALGKQHLDGMDAGTMLTMTAGLSYALMGLIVGVGVAAPPAGARYLNVEDVEELREDRSKLANASMSCVLIGASLILLAIAPTASPLGWFTREVAALAAGACLLAGILIGSRSGAMADELTKQIGLEASAFTLYFSMLLIGGWAAAAHLGYVAWMPPLAFIATTAMIYLVAIFWVSGKRGLLKTR